ncbi:hypothetical protein DL95DRAFT_453540 [Leptodontidium sp. 2 PMI_412]|nr:hypothetical protein DL95DRAFT_453540 [Leptodontidium sp. 2 PMI_412]
MCIIEHTNFNCGCTHVLHKVCAAYKVRMDNRTDHKVCPDLAGWIEDEGGPRCIGPCKVEVIEEYQFEELEKKEKKGKQSGEEEKKNGPGEVAIYEETEDDGEEAAVADPGVFAVSNFSAGNRRSYGFLNVWDIEPGFYDNDTENRPVEEAEEEHISEDIWEDEDVN